MICQLTSVLVGIFLLQSTVVDAKADEILQMKVFDHDFRASDAEMHAMLKKANLTGHGFIKEVTTKLVQKADDSKDYQKAYFFYKVVNCSQIQEVDQELDNLLPGDFGKDAEEKFKKEIKYRHLDKTGLCKVGLEVHFMEAEGCYDNQKGVTKRRKKRGCGWACVWCKVTTVTTVIINNNISNNNFSSSRRRRSQRSQSSRRRRSSSRPVPNCRRNAGPEC